MALSAIITPPLLLIPPPTAHLPFSISKPNSLTLSSPSLRRSRISEKSLQLWRVYAAQEDALTSETQIENAQQIVSASTSNGDEGVSTVVSALLFIAFIGLSLLTLGVIYLAVQDFLQKREKEKFEKEEAERKKGGKKKTKIRARSGPRGFGQKIEEDAD